jgi:transposase-like protein
MAAGMPPCPNCGEAIFAIKVDIDEEKTWRCKSCNATGTMSSLSRAY